MACCNPVPPLVKQNLQTLHMIIFNARNKPLESLPASSALSSASSAAPGHLENETDYNENPLKCPLDLGQPAELGPAAATSCLIDRHMDRIVRKFKPVPAPRASHLVKTMPDLSVFGSDRTKKAAGGDRRNGSKKSVGDSGESNRPPVVQLVSPFKRYQLLKPYLDSIEQQEERAQQQQQKQKNLDSKPSDVDLRYGIVRDPYFTFYCPTLNLFICQRKIKIVLKK